MKVIKEFENSLNEYGVECSRTTLEEFPSSLSRIIKKPAVSVPLPFNKISLNNLPLTLNPSPQDLLEAKTGITPGYLGIASTGTVINIPDEYGSELMSLYPPLHVAVMPAGRIVSDLSEGFNWLQSNFEKGLNNVIFETGPSATGDMGAMVEGVHGPEQVHVILVDNE